MVASICLAEGHLLQTHIFNCFLITVVISKQNWSCLLKTGMLNFRITFGLIT